jgi:hypothetical protein
MARGERRLTGPVPDHKFRAISVVFFLIGRPSTPYEDELLTEREKAAFRRGEAEYLRGEYLTLEELRAHLSRLRKRNAVPRRR